MEAFVVALQSVWNDSGFSAFTMGHAIMMLVGIILLYLAIGKGFEPLLLSPIAFGCLLANVPKTGFEDQPGVMQVILYGINHEIFPPLIFLGVGAMTDFGPLIANPKTLLLGAAAQAGVFISLLGAMMLGFTVQEASAIGIIGGADGPTAIYLAAKMAPNLLGAIAVAAYSYMSLVPLIQPPIMKLCTTEADRKIVMEQLRPVGLEKLDVTVVELPEWEKRPDGCIVQYTGWGEIEPYRFGEMALLEKKLPVNLLRSLASHWVELQQENATLRAVLNGKLVSAPECLYDTFILRELEKQENEFNEARLVGQVLGKYRLGIGDAWIALRIEQFIKDGLLIPITAPEPGTSIYHRILQKTGKT